jgi:hypothetical protein
MLTARAITRATVPREIADWSIIVSFAQRAPFAATWRRLHVFNALHAT